MGVRTNRELTLRMLAEGLEECYGSMWEANIAFLRELADELEADNKDRQALAAHWNA